MRITFGLAVLTSACLLAGCNRGAANNSANAPAPAANMSEPAPAANGAAPAAANRDNEVAECTSDMSRHLRRRRCRRLLRMRGRPGRGRRAPE